MKISIKSNLVIPTLFSICVLALPGCGGSGVNVAAATVYFPNGIYVATGNGKATKYSVNTSGSGTISYGVPAISFANSNTIFKDKMYIGGLGVVSCISATNPAKSTEFYGLPGNPIGGISGIAVDSLGRLYISDQDHGRLIRINDIDGTGYAELNLAPFTSGAVSISRSIALDSSNRIYVLDRNGNRVLRFSSMADAAPVAFDAKSKDQTFNGFSDPFDIQIDKSDRIYVSDLNHGRIARFDDMIGKNWVTYGKAGSGLGMFHSPSHIAVDSTNHIYIKSDSPSQIIRIDDMSGNGWTTFGATGSNPGQYPDVRDICVL
jgi:hypothetical protein